MDEKSIKTVNLSELLADYICEKDYGTIIHYQEIEEVIGIKYKAKRYYQQITKAQKILRSRGKVMKSIGKNGDYQILYPGDYTTAYARELKLAKNRVSRGGEILNGAPVNDMTVEERQTFNAISDFHTRLEAQTISSYVEVKRLRDRRSIPVVTGTI